MQISRLAYSLPLLATLIAPKAHAEEGTVLSTARELAQQGLEAYDGGRYTQALDRLTRAYAIVHVPTLGVAMARTLVKLNRFVEAAELYLEATRLQKADFWQPTQFSAQRDAERERAALLPRIPRLEISVDGVPASEVSVTINGTAFPSTMIGVPAMVDPRTLKIIGKHGVRTVEQTVQLKEGAHDSLTLKFPAAASSGEPPANVARADSGAPAEKPSTKPSQPHNTQKTIGWVALGVGGAGIATGAVTGILALTGRPAGCVGNHCPTSQDAEVTKFNRLLDITTLGFAIGGVAAAAGVTLILTAPKTPAQVGLWVSPQSANLVGNF
jgi:hypothetical protein